MRKLLSGRVHRTKCLPYSFKMLFGDKSEFAVEVIPDSAYQRGSRGSTQVTGRVRVWMTSFSIGNFEEPLCVLGCVSNELAETLVELEEYWHPSFASQTADELYDTLDRLCFAAHRGASLEESLDSILDERKAMGLSNHSFLMNSSEAFDGWKAFLVKPPGTAVHVLWTLGDEQNAIRRSVFDAHAFKSAVSAFADWTHTSEWRALRVRLD